MDQLEIIKEQAGQEMILHCLGRLDANHAGHLNDSIDALVREGHDQIVLDLVQVEYLSSFGIRALVNQYKNLKAINGFLYISGASTNVAQVLEMVGMLKILSTRPVSVPQSNADKEKVQESVCRSGFQFQLIWSRQQKPALLSLFGNPLLLAQSAYTETHARQFEASEIRYALGLGAIGPSFGNCRNRFGEFILLGNNVAYLPADGSGKPDYISGTGRLVASLTELYGIHPEGEFSRLIRFEPENKNQSIALSDIVSALIELNPDELIAIVMVAESAGLIGASLNQSPVEGDSLFSYPEVRNSVNFTTEPAHNKKLAVSLGFAGKDIKPVFQNFSRKLKPDSSLWGHFHAAVFPYMTLKKREIDLAETINGLFNESEIIDILHLSNDTREINGLGESRFIQGYCWVASLKYKQ